MKILKKIGKNTKQKIEKSKKKAIKKQKNHLKMPSKVTLVHIILS